MYVLTKNNDTISKYTPKLMEIAEDGIILEGKLIPCSIEESDVDKFDVFIDYKDYKDLLGLSISTFFSNFVMGLTKKKNNFDDSRIIWEDLTGTAYITYNKNTNFIKFDKELFWMRIKYITTDRVILRKSLKKLSNDVFQLFEVKVEIPELEDTQKEDIQKTKNILKKEKTVTENKLNSEFLLLTKNLVKKIDNSLYPGYIFWVNKNDTICIQYYSYHNILSINQGYFSTLFRISSAPLYDIFYNLFEKHFKLNIKSILFEITMMDQKKKHFSTLPKPKIDKHSESHFINHIFEFIKNSNSNTKNSFWMTWTQNNIKLRFERATHKVYFTEKFMKRFPSIGEEELKCLCKQTIEKYFLK